MPTKMTKSHGNTKSSKLILRPHLTYEQHLTLVIISILLNYVFCLASGHNFLFIPSCLCGHYFHPPLLIYFHFLNF